MADSTKVFVGWNKPFNNITTNLDVTAVYKNKTFTVKFVDSDNSLLTKQSVLNGQCAERPSVDPTKKGYSFSGWTMNGQYVEVSEVAISADTTFKAAYAAKKYRVIYDIHGNKFYYNGISMGADIPKNTASTDWLGKTFVGWESNVPGITTSDKMPWSDVTFTAQYTTKICKVVFLLVDESESTTTNTIVSTQYVEYGGAARLPFIIGEEGYKFSGWKGDAGHITSDITIPNVKTRI